MRKWRRDDVRTIDLKHCLPPIVPGIGQDSPPAGFFGRSIGSRGNCRAGQNRFLLAGDGWTPGTNGDSDPFYNILLTFGSGNTLSGTYTPTTNTFIGGSSYTLGGLTYTLEEFSFRRTLGDAVSQTVATPGGDGNDYSGNFRVSALTAVPEPATWALMILGFGAVGGAMRRRTVRIATRPA